jgi:hypothetical protein
MADTVQAVGRTQADILARYRAAAADPADVLGWRREVLALAMTAESLAAAVPDLEVVADTQMTRGEVEQHARSYLDLAVDKIVWHRGISAARSVQKLAEYAWLLGRDDVVAAMDAAEYEQYGAPKVRTFAVGMGWPFLDLADGPDDLERLERMSTGRLCVADCANGCGQ